MKNLKGKSLKRAMETKDAVRLVVDMPLITDTTELITPGSAHKMLRTNKLNRPVAWGKVEEYRKIMEKGEWKFHGQGIIFDSHGNLLTGQKRLWAIIYSGIPQYLRVSRGSPPETATVIDRGSTQTSRDLASRKSDRKHSPTEASLARGILAFVGNTKPSPDEIAEVMADYDKVFKIAIKENRRIKKTKIILITLSAVCWVLGTNLTEEDDRKVQVIFGKLEVWATQISQALNPMEPQKCWNRGAAFTLAMEKAISIVEKEI